MKNFNKKPENYKTKPLTNEDPLVVGTNKYGKFTQDEKMIPFDVLEDQKYGQENDPEKTFTTTDQISDTEAHYFDENINFENRLNDDVENKETPSKRDIKDVLINGIPLIKITKGEISNEKLPQQTIKNYQEKNIQQTSINRGEKTSKDIVQYGKKGQPHKRKRQVRSIQAKIAKKHKETEWQEWPTSNHSSNGTQRNSSNLSQKNLDKPFKHGKDLDDYIKTA